MITKKATRQLWKRLIESRLRLMVDQPAMEPKFALREMKKEKCQKDQKGFYVMFIDLLIVNDRVSGKTSGSICVTRESLKTT